HQAVGSMVIDIGGGTTEVAVIALSGLVEHESLRVAGEAMDQSISEWMRRKHNLLIGIQGAESIKWKIGSATELETEESMPVRGRDTVAGLPKIMQVDSVEIREALSGSVAQIVASVRRVLERMPPELAADILDRGMVLCGGGSMLQGLREHLLEATNLPTYVDSEDPLSAVVRGNARILEEFDNYRQVLL
ncbi:MAG: rod shape-determining protein, partial [Gemmatimonadetes bacterium]|nr:rod shape-determining protein [Gemmatimonadota bacterium]